MGDEGEVGLMCWACVCNCGPSAVLGPDVLEIVLPSQNDLNIARECVCVHVPLRTQGSFGMYRFVFS